MRSLILPCTSCAALALLSGGHPLATDYGRERSLTTRSELELDLETTSFEMKIDDKPVEDTRGSGGSSSSLVRKCVLTDHVLSGAMGAPARVRRTFEALHDESTVSFGEDERSDERDYPLAGLTLELALDEEGAVEVQVVEGDKPDDAVLEGHTLALALDAFLPEGEVELEAGWELEDEALKRALATGLSDKLFYQPPPEEGRRGEGERRGSGGGRGRGGSARTLGFLVWEGKAKLVALDEEFEGLACAKIALELAGKGDLPEPSSRGGRGFLFDPLGVPESLRAGTVQAELKGELYVSLEKHRPVALKLDGTLRTENSFEREREGQRMSSHSVQEGRLTLTVSVEESP